VEAQGRRDGAEHRLDADGAAAEAMALLERLE
jgi:hypothetical protein